MEDARTVFSRVDEEGTVDDALAGRNVRNLLTANARTGGRVDAERGGVDRWLAGDPGIGGIEAVRKHETGRRVDTTSGSKR
ncbi:hypothetical protein BP00DRAFT_52352 [Aspergillus indologenus CBS 114.80]|uniref:Uncharacterized protein n=1 Tax=Aspergillus indologenus CBS 114.80 TaxID=1450541 RepID=A0A2V5HQ49_9EURO|nr:hypothetical protein BP00DRAFT_52352 [Aspergillus indologenus CBS 114.80]